MSLVVLSIQLGIQGSGLTRLGLLQCSQYPIVSPTKNGMLHVLHTTCVCYVAGMCYVGFMSSMTMYSPDTWGIRGVQSASGVCASLEVPKPDVGQQCKAMIGICQASTVWMATCTGTMQRVGELSKQGSGNNVHAKQLSVEVEKLGF